ncbi:hypothetical protein BC938DRAFT_471406 [Jimgerdemannia flammicorona]|uniref:Uncharacterized protein n=1 Tax=Jimgerdemannia flammicorona TaxID=994334 RepID=A0A433Q889_9FUNG|nr:hypothetical protein BC938DRAFT_471406 [Jimgerdemannia flammicorona]
MEGAAVFAREEFPDGELVLRPALTSSACNAELARTMLASLALSTCSVHAYENQGACVEYELLALGRIVQVIAQKLPQLLCTDQPRRRLQQSRLLALWTQVLLDVSERVVRGKLAAMGVNRCERHVKCGFYQCRASGDSLFDDVEIATMIAGDDLDPKAKGVGDRVSVWH